VTERLSSNINFRPIFHPASTTQTITSNVVEEAGLPGPAFGITIQKNDLSNAFDAKHLISLVPKQHRENAVKLLQIFENQPEEVTFTTQGALLINGESIPGSNMYLLFPALFKRGKSYIGVKELVEKLHEMKLAHLITQKQFPSNKIAYKSVTLPKQGSEPPFKKAKSTNWWFLK